MLHIGPVWNFLKKCLFIICYMEKIQPEMDFLLRGTVEYECT